MDALKSAIAKARGIGEDPSPQELQELEKLTIMAGENPTYDSKVNPEAANQEGLAVSAPSGKGYKAIINPTGLDKEDMKMIPTHEDAMNFAKTKTQLQQRFINEYPDAATKINTVKGIKTKSGPVTEQTNIFGEKSTFPEDTSQLDFDKSKEMVSLKKDLLKQYDEVYMKPDGGGYVDNAPDKLEWMNDQINVIKGKKKKKGGGRDVSKMSKADREVWKEGYRRAKDDNKSEKEAEAAGDQAVKAARAKKSVGTQFKDTPGDKLINWARQYSDPMDLKDTWLP
jgi:hypothetical protein